jgi:hypothetical protein
LEENNMNGIKGLIEALQIFLKYGNPDYPTHCEHDVLWVCINPENVSDKDRKRLEELGFNAHEDGDDCFKSYHYGSA